MNESHLEKIFQSLGSILRIRILRYVASTHHSLPHIGMIASHVGISSTLCSRHIAKLIECGLLNEFTSAQYKMIEINPQNFPLIESFLNSLKESNGSRLPEQSPPSSSQNPVV